MEFMKRFDSVSCCEGNRPAHIYKSYVAIKMKLNDIIRLLNHR